MSAQRNKDRRKKDAAIVILLLLASMILVASVREKLHESQKNVREKHDVYFLPPAEQVVTMSLGYKAALADVLWAHVLVSQGLHTFQQRRFENLLRLYEAINRLDPTWRTPYLLAEALITFQSSSTPYEEVLKAREILTLGTAHRPLDGELWLNLGQFVSYLAPASYLEDTHPEVAQRWRQEGVAYLQRAAELGMGNIGWQALGGAVILERAGEHGAAIAFLEKAYASTDDEELKADIMGKLKRIGSSRNAAMKSIGQIRLEAHHRRDRALVASAKEEPLLRNRSELFLLGPRPKPGRCAGGGHLSAECASSWRTWASRWDDENAIHPISQAPLDEGL